MDNIIFATSIQPDTQHLTLENLSNIRDKSELAKKIISSMSIQKGGRLIGQIMGNEIATLPIEESETIREIHERLKNEFHIANTIGVGEDVNQALTALSYAKDKEIGTIRVYDFEIEQELENEKPKVAVSEEDVVRKSEEYIPIDDSERMKIASLINSIQTNKEIFEQLKNQNPPAYASIVSLIQSLTIILQQDKRAKEESVAKIIAKINNHLKSKTDKKIKQYAKKIQQELDLAHEDVDSDRKDRFLSHHQLKMAQKKKYRDYKKSNPNMYFLFNLLENSKK